MLTMGPAVAKRAYRSWKIVAGTARGRRDLEKNCTQAGRKKVKNDQDPTDRDSSEGAGFRKKVAK